MTHVRVETLVRIDERFVPLTTMRAQPIDEGELPVIEGGINLVVDGRQVLTPDFWDDIDCLWGYILDGLAEAVDGRPFHTAFPNSAIPIAIEPAGDQRLRFAVGDRNVDYRSEVLVDMEDFARAMADGADAFFRQVKVAYPSYETSWVEGKIARLRAA